MHFPFSFSARLKASLELNVNPVFPFFVGLNFNGYVFAKWVLGTNRAYIFFKRAVKAKGKPP